MPSTRIFIVFGTTDAPPPVPGVVSAAGMKTSCVVGSRNIVRPDGLALDAKHGGVEAGNDEQIMRRHS